VQGVGDLNAAAGPRMYFTEADYQYAGFSSGLPANGVYNPVYQWFVNNVAGGYFTNNWATTLAAPTIINPSGGFWKFSQVELQWNSTGTNSQFQIEVVPVTGGGTLSWSPLTIPIPTRDPDGRYRYTLPCYCGDGNFTNRVYSWRVRSVSPVATSAWSAWANFTLDLQVSDGLGEAVEVMTGILNYYGKVTLNAANRLIIQAYRSSGFSGRPTGQMVLSDWGQFAILGLPPTNYAVRAFIDQNNNSELDTWESMGFYKDTGKPYSTYYTSAYMPPDSEIIVRDRDIDNDKLPDAWEYQNYGSLTAMGSGTVYGSPAYTDSDGDGVNDFDEYIYSTDAKNPDTDGDGINDGIEILVLGSNPRSNDSNNNGVLDLSELAAGMLVTGTGGAEGIKIDKLRFDAQGRPIIEWDVPANILGRTIMFVVEGSKDLKTWTEVGSTSTPGTVDSSAAVTDSSVNVDKTMYYRLRFYLQ
jgi:hypothetical protein